MSMKMFCLTGCLLLALLFSGCAATGMNTSKQALWYSADEAAAIYTDNGAETKRLEKTPFSLNSDARSVSEFISTQPPDSTERYLVEASFLADKASPLIIMSDISSSPLKEYQECCGRDNNPDHLMNLIPEADLLPTKLFLHIQIPFRTFQIIKERPVDMSG